MSTMTTVTELLARVTIDAPGGCWYWTGHINSNGYGQLGQRYAHRLMHETTLGPIPPGYVVHHECEVPHCVNPGHLKAMSRSDHNHQPGHSGDLNSSKSACPQGHPYDNENTLLEPLLSGKAARRCRKCREAEAAARRKTTGPTKAELAEIEDLI